MPSWTGGQRGLAGWRAGCRAAELLAGGHRSRTHAYPQPETSCELEAAWTGTRAAWVRPANSADTGIEGQLTRDAMVGMRLSGTAEGSGRRVGRLGGRSGSNGGRKSSASRSSHSCSVRGATISAAAARLMSALAGRRGPVRARLGGVFGGAGIRWLVTFHQPPPAGRLPAASARAAQSPR